MTDESNQKKSCMTKQQDLQIYTQIVNNNDLKWQLLAFNKRVEDIGLILQTQSAGITEHSAQHIELIHKEWNFKRNTQKFKRVDRKSVV